MIYGALGTTLRCATREALIALYASVALSRRFSRDGIKTTEHHDSPVQTLSFEGFKNSLSAPGSVEL